MPLHCMRYLATQRLIKSSRLSPNHFRITPTSEFCYHYARITSTVRNRYFTSSSHNHSPLLQSQNGVSLPALEEIRDHGEVVDEPPGFEEEPRIDEAAEHIDWDATVRLQEEVKIALRNENYDALIRAFLRLSDHPESLRNLPSTFLGEVIRNLQPRYFIDPAKEAYRRVHPQVVRHWRIETGQLLDIFVSYTQAIRKIAARIDFAGKILGIREYAVLLESASATGDTELANFLFQSMIRRRIEPDTICYNHYFGALTWSYAFEPMESRELRVTQRRLVSKRRQEGKWGLSNQPRRSPETLKKWFVAEYENMVRRGISANVSTYCLFMLVFSRDGDMASVKALLWKIWEIDVQAVMNDEAVDLSFENKMAEDSPLYPTQELLFTIAHVFGSNNDMSAALRLVDHTARKFSLHIDLRTWSQLAQWTYVLSTRRTGTTGRKLERREDDSVGQLSRDSFESFWCTMTSEPYNVQPTDEMWNLRIQSFFRTGRRLDAITAMQEYRGIAQTRDSREPDALVPSDSGHPLNDRDWARFEQVLNVQHDAFFLKCVKLALRSKPLWNWEWRFCGVQDFIKRWSRWLPDTGVSYDLRDCYLQFHPERSGKVSVAVDMFKTGPGLSLIKPRQLYSGKPRIGRTKFQRLSKRNEQQMLRRTRSPYDDAPEEPGFISRLGPDRLESQWFEKEGIRDWVSPD